MVVRIFDLAKELGVQSPELIQWFKVRGVAKISAAQPVTPEQVQMARENFHQSSNTVDLPPVQGVTRDTLLQGWVGSKTVIGENGVWRPAPKDDVVHAHTQDILEASLCGSRSATRI
jgi:hypothetical protein